MLTFFGVSYSSDWFPLAEAGVFVVAMTVAVSDGVENGER
jgi:hypothetical protein